MAFNFNDILFADGITLFKADNLDITLIYFPSTLDTNQNYDLIY